MSDDVGVALKFEFEWVCTPAGVSTPTNEHLIFSGDGDQASVASPASYKHFPFADAYDCHGRVADQGF